MALKKYDKKLEEEKEALELKEEEEKEALALTEAEESQNISEEELINKTIEYNSKLEEAEQTLDLDSNEEQLLEEAEKYRGIYSRYAKKQKILSYIMTGLTGAVAIATFVVLLTLQNTVTWVIYLMFGLLVAVLVASFVVSKIKRNQLSKKAEEYMDDLFTLQAKYVYAIEGLSEVRYVKSNQLDNKVFTSCHFYKDIKDVRSRDYCVVKYKEKELTCVDMAGNIIQKGRTYPLFLGKFYVYETDFDKDVVINFQLKGGQLSKPIMEEEAIGLKLVENNSKYVVYSNYDKWKSILSKKVITEIQKFRIDKSLIDVIVCIRNGYTCIGIDYADEFLNVPVQNKFNVNIVRRTISDLKQVLKVLDSIKYR